MWGLKFTRTLPWRLRRRLMQITRSSGADDLTIRAHECALRMATVTTMLTGVVAELDTISRHRMCPQSLALATSDAAKSINGVREELLARGRAIQNEFALHVARKANSIEAHHKLSFPRDE
jgi:hypothetical protein